MNAKLTLTIDKSTIKRAKKYAGSKGRSLSNIIENYLKVITTDSQNIEVEDTPIVKSLKGSFSAPADFDYKKELTKSLSKKYISAG
jgi:hypothetical protein